MIELIEPYAPRPIRSLGQWAEARMRLQVHGIAYRLAEPRTEVIDAAHELVRRELPKLIAEKNHYGVGFVGVHDGRGENELQHHVYAAPKDHPTHLEYKAPMRKWSASSSR